MRNGRFTRGKGLFCRTEWVPPAEVADGEYPLVLSTGRRLWHYHTGTQTRNSVGLEELFPEELLEMNAADAEVLRLILQGGSVIDWRRLHFQDAAEVDRYLNLIINPSTNGGS